MLQKIRTGDIDFMIISTANAATVAPESGVMSIHFIFRSEDHLMKALADPGRDRARSGRCSTRPSRTRHVLALATLGPARPLRQAGDRIGRGHAGASRCGCRRRATEDAMFPAYGAQTVHMPFGNVYTCLQTGVVDIAENGINVYQQQALRSRAGDVADRARGQQLRDLGQRQGVGQPDRGAEGLGAGGGRRGGANAAGQGVRAGAQVAGEAAEDGREVRHRRRQVRASSRSPSRSRTSCARSSGPHAVKLAAAHVRVDRSRPVSIETRRPRPAPADRHLKWRALDPLERVLMVLCGVCLAGFTSTRVLDVVTREIGHPLAVAAGSDERVLHLRHRSSARRWRRGATITCSSRR